MYFCPENKNKNIMKHLTRAGILLVLLWTAACRTDEPFSPPPEYLRNDWDTSLLVDGLMLPGSGMQHTSLVYEGDQRRMQHLFSKFRNGGLIRLGFIGGSITGSAMASTPDKSYPAVLTLLMNKSFDGLQFTSVVRGYGATGTYFGCCRVDDDLLKEAPDLIVVEFAVNDREEDALQVRLTLEGLLRKCLKTGTPVILLLSEYRHGNPVIQAVHEQLGRYYGLPVISMGAAIRPFIQSGLIQWEDLYVDDIHPNDQGHLLKALLLYRYLSTAYSYYHPSETWPGLPPNYFTDRYENAGVLKLTQSAVCTSNEGWDFVEREAGRLGLVPASKNAHLQILCTWRECALVYQISTDHSAHLEVSIDGVPTDTLCNLSTGNANFTMTLFQSPYSEARTIDLRNLDTEAFGISYVLYVP